MQITYCDKCGQKIDVSTHGNRRIVRRSKIPYPTELNNGNLIAEVSLEIDVLPKQYDICMGCRLEAAEKVLDELKKEYKQK